MDGRPRGQPYFLSCVTCTHTAQRQSPHHPPPPLFTLRKQYAATLCLLSLYYIFNQTEPQLPPNLWGRKRERVREKKREVGSFVTKSQRGQPDSLQIMKNCFKKSYRQIMSIMVPNCFWRNRFFNCPLWQQQQQKQKKKSHKHSPNKRRDSQRSLLIVQPFVCSL